MMIGVVRSRSTTNSSGLAGLDSLLVGIGADHKCGDWRQDLDEYRRRWTAINRSLLHRVKAEAFVATRIAEMKGEGGNFNGLNISYCVLSLWCSSPNAMSPSQASVPT